MLKYIGFLLFTVYAGVHSNTPCHDLSLTCLGEPCSVQINSDIAQLTSTPWRTNCLDTGNHWVKLAPKHYNWSPDEWQWQTQPEFNYSIIHTPKLRVGELSTRLPNPYSWTFLSNYRYLQNTTVGFGYGFNEQLTGLTHIHLQSTDALPVGFTTEIMVATKDHSLVLAARWQEYWNNKMQRHKAYIGGGWHVQEEYVFPFENYFFRQWASVDWSSKQVSLDLVAGRAWHIGFPELGVHTTIPWPQQQFAWNTLSLAPWARMLWWPNSNWTIQAEWSSFGWPRKMPLHVKLSLIYKITRTKASIKTLARHKNHTDAAWLADVHSINNVSSHDALNDTYRTHIPLSDNWQKQMQELALEAAKSNVACRIGESLRAGLCLPISCTEWSLSTSQSNFNTLNRPQLSEIPHNCLIYTHLFDVVPYNHIEIGSLRPWRQIHRPN